ncbi:hypothetical protein EVAR_103242_1 [Eumeta japonica]|uniref:Uncharacterized protein n=1 Tax=Eumeta variegata TaxID=151549 RepID=A0A4C1X651_EUMVA|nr:hypothetical protein EVAR_103242_1 [Eumeta japonica]
MRAPNRRDIMSNRIEKRALFGTPRRYFIGRPSSAAVSHAPLSRGPNSVGPRVEPAALHGTRSDSDVLDVRAVDLNRVLRNLIEI